MGLRTVLAAVACAAAVVMLAACAEDEAAVEPEGGLEEPPAEPGAGAVDLDPMDAHSWAELVEAISELQLATVSLAADRRDGFAAPAVRDHLDALADPGPRDELVEVLRGATDGIPSFVLRRVTLTPHIEVTDVSSDPTCPVVAYRGEVEVSAAGYRDRLVLGHVAMAVRELSADAPERDRNPTGWIVSWTAAVPEGGLEALDLQGTGACG